MKGITILVALLCPCTLGAQGTPADTVLAAKVKASVTDSLRLEVNRRSASGSKLAPRTTYITRFAKRADSLLTAHLKFVPPPPPQPLPQPDSGVVVNDTTPGPAELPRSVPNPTFGKAKRVLAVSSSASDLQAVLNAVQDGDSITLAGDFPAVRIPTKACGTLGVSITGVEPALAIGARQTPTAKSARITTTNSEPAIQFASPTCGWRLDGFEVIGATPGTTINYGMVSIGDGGWAAGGQVQTTLDKVPTNIVLSHLYIHGLPTTNSSRCIALQSAETVIRDSWIDECHGRGFDSQAIEGWNGPGPFLIENNYLAGAGENIMFGGADPGIPGLRPSDITIRRNHLQKFPSWQGVWTVKNCLELKNAQRVLIERNVMGPIWPSGQEGMCLVIKSSQGSETNPQSLPQGTTDVTAQGNLIDTAAVAIDVHASDCYPTCPSISTARVTIRGNLARHVMKVFPWPTSASGRAAGMLITKDVKDITVVGNSFYHDQSIGNTAGSAITFDYGGARRLTFTNNYFEAGAYGVFFGGKIGTAALDSMAGPGNWLFSGNAVVYGQASRYPAGNTFPSVSTLTPSVGASITDVLNGVNGVVISPPMSARRSARRPSRVVRPRLTPQDSLRLRTDPSNPWKPSAKR